MFHGTLTLVTPLRVGAREAASKALEGLDRAIQAREPHPLGQVEELYFAHWGLQGGESPEGVSSGDGLLLFGADLRLTESLRSGEQLGACVTLLVDRLAAQAPAATRVFDALYACCEGYPAAGLRAPEQVKAYLLAHAVPYNTRHVDFAYRVATVPDIRQLLGMRARVEDFLKEGRHASLLEQPDMSPVRDALRGHLGLHLSRVSGPEWQRKLSAALHTAALATLMYLPLDTPLRLLFQLKNRLLPPGRTVERVSVPDSLREQVEARQGPIQNSMILVSDVPRSWLGRLRQRFFMALVNWRLKRNVVGLNDIRTLHCAHWALFQHGSRRQMVFMVTYDESWEAYIDAFVDHEDVSTFLKLIWGGTRGFPSGLPFVEPFKQWVRSVQCPTRAHYSAFLHAGPRPQPFALTDLHELCELRRVLATEGPRGEDDAEFRRALGVFLEQGRFPYQDKLLSPRRSAALLWHSLLDRLRSSFTLPRSDPHATATRMGVLCARAAVRRPRSEGRPALAVSPVGRRPGARRLWVQVHGGRRLPDAEGRGRRPGAGVAARDPEGGSHDRGPGSSRGT